MIPLTSFTYACKDPEPMPNVTQYPNVLHESFWLVPGLKDKLKVPTLNMQDNINVRRIYMAGDTRCGIDRSKSYRNDSMLSEISACPWHYMLNYDENRVPKFISEAVCNCKGPTPCLTGEGGSSCRPLKYYIRVLRRAGCSNGVYQYREVTEAINIGCTCRLRSKRVSSIRPYD